MGMPDSRSQASRLNHLLFEVVAVAPPQVAYSFVTKSLPALHTFDRAGGVAGTRRETKSQSSRCSYLSENASIRVERFRNPSDPFAAECLWQSEAADCDRAPSFQAAMPLASRGLVPTHTSPQHTWSPDENRRESARSDVEQSRQWRASCPESPLSGRISLGAPRHGAARARRFRRASDGHDWSLGGSYGTEVVYLQPAAISEACKSGRIPLFHHL